MPSARRRPASSPASTTPPGTSAPTVAAPVVRGPADAAPSVEALVHDLIGRIADKWTLIVLEVLAEHGELRFTRLGELVGGISPKMLTQTLRRMERDGLVSRTVYPVIPPRVEYRRTELGASLGEAFCNVWYWAEANLQRVADARGTFDAGARTTPPTADAGS
ncbi:MAG: winged helix-turn-helix transcriptional regulator [Gemmatimonadaceae bacterium]